MDFLGEQIQPKRISYAVFGILLGVGFPLFAIFIEVNIKNVGFLSILLGKTNPLMLIIETAPLVLGTVFYFFGKREEKISELFIEETKSNIQIEKEKSINSAEEVGKYGSWELDLLTMKNRLSRGIYLIFQLDPSGPPFEFEEFMNMVVYSDRDTVRNALTDIVQNRKKGFNIQYRVKLANGDIRSIVGKGTAIYDKENKPVKIVGTAQDLTELVLAQHEAQFYKDAIDKTAIVAITDGGGKIVHVNENFCIISGYKKEELIGKKHNILKSGVMGDQFFTNMWREISSGRLWHGEICNKNKEGKIYWVDTAIVPFLDENGRPEKYVSIRSDITEKKLAEKALDNAYQRLEKAERIGRFGSWECDLQKKEFHGSKGLHELLQITGDFPLTFELFKEVIEVNDRKIFEAVIEQSLISRQPFSSTYRIILKDNSVKWLQTDGYPLDDGSDNCNKIVGSVRDITEKIESDKMLLEATSQIEAASQTKARFLANMSHEIRTPMNGIIGMTNLLIGNSTDPMQIEKLKIIQNCGSTLLELLNDILDFSKLEANKFELESHPFSLHDNGREIVELLNIKASEKAITLTYIANPDVPVWIRGDVTRFRQVITNLISNAIKFTEKGGVTISSVTTPLQDNMCEFRFSVKDTGIGIPDDVKNRLFQSFSQVDASTTRKYGGTGLGLAISKGICEKMGGTILVESEIGKGTNFIFSFKAELANEVKEFKADNPFGEVDSEMAQKYPLNILVAEDNKINQMVINGFLGKLGYKAKTVNNGEEVLNELSKINYDLVLMDCHMPVMDGFEATQKIVEQYKKKTVVIAVTASTMKEDLDRCFDCGMNGFVGKPITINALISVLNKCIQKEYL